MTSSQDQDGPSGLVPSSKPNDPPSTPPANQAVPPEPEKEGSQNLSLAQPQAPPQEKNAVASVETPPRPSQHLQESASAQLDQNPTPITNHTVDQSWTYPGLNQWLETANPILTSAYMQQMSQALQPSDMSSWPAIDYQLPVTYDHVASIDSDDDDDDGYAPDVATYGRLEFKDGTFWITTRNIIIGRDQRAYTQARKQLERERKLGLPPGSTLHSPDKPTAGFQAYTKSYISEEGGLLGPESDDEDQENQRPAKRRKTNDGGHSSTAKQQQEGQARSRIISSRKYIDHTPGAVLVDVDNLRPSDDVVARVRIHAEHVAKTKGISRDHAKIQYNSQTKVWEIRIIGRNGIFLNENYHGKDEVLTLRSGDNLQIQDVCFKFYLTGAEKGMTGAEEDSASDAPVRTYSQGGKEMSFDFQSRDDGDKETSSSSVISGDVPLVLASDSEHSDLSDKEMEDAPDLHTPDRDEHNERNATETIRETVERDHLDGDIKKSPSTEDASRMDQMPAPLKKRGPGRPPKNGIMSKREERLLRKLALEEARRNMPPQEPGEQPQKRKVGRPRKHPRPEDESDLPPEKRKYKPRKQKGEDGEEDADGEKPSKEKSQKAKTPPLELSRDDYTEEQLQKPTKNYQLLIDEIMVGAPPQGYSLKQIYKRIQKRWPYFYFNVDTKGWESSVRHNLLGSDCFKKIDGHWHRVPGVPLESGKKQRKPSPIASPRPAGLYNGGYGHHPYQPPHHAQHPGHQPIAHNTGLSQPNLPPRYPPNGQAYQIAQGPPHRPGQPGIAPGQQPPARPGFPQPQAPTAAPQAHSYANVNAATRSQFAANQPPPYNPAFANRPQPPPGTNLGVAGPGAGQVSVQNSAQRPPPPRPGQTPQAIPQQGFQSTQMLAQSNVQRNTPASHQQPSSPNSTPPAPLGPVIDPILRDFIKDFKSEVIKQLQAREGKRSEAVAMSVINRGLGLTDRSLTPECEQYEKLILDIFHQHKATFPTVLASKRRAQEASRAASATPAHANPAATAPPLAANGPIASALPRNEQAPTVSTMPASNGTTPGTTRIDTGELTTTTGQGGASSVAAEAAAAQADPKTGGDAVTKTVESVPAKAIAAATPTGTNVSVTTAPLTTVSMPSSQPAAVPGPSKPNHSAAAGIPASTKSPAPAAAPVTTASTSNNVTVNHVSATATPVKASSNTDKVGSEATAKNPTVVETAIAPKPATHTPAPNAPTTAASATLPKITATAPAPSTHAPTLAAPSVNSKTATTAAAPVSTAPVSAGSRGPSAGQQPSFAGPAASSSPAPNSNANGSRAASTSAASTSTKEKKDVQLLDPKLVAVIMAFKRTILPTLVGRLGSLQGESLVMSAVDRLLGFTDETFVQAKNEQQKQHFHEAEKALMLHLGTRFRDYVKNKTTSK